MNKIVNKIGFSFLMLVVAGIPYFAQADDFPTEPNLCASSSTPGVDGAIQTYITNLCNSSVAMKLAIFNAQQQQDSATGPYGGPVGAAGGLGTWSGNKPVAPLPANAASSGSSVPSIYK